MKTVQAIKVAAGVPFKFKGEHKVLNNPLVLVFGNRYILEDEGIYKEVRDLFPSGHIVFGSTSGEIMEDSVYENSAVLTAIEFEKGSFLVKRENVANFANDDTDLGEHLMKSFSQENLKHLFLVSEGSTVNGSALIAGFEQNKNKGVGLSGGLCGDDGRFEKTLSSYNENPKEGEIVAIAFYGESLEITSANYGGWMPFGPERVITKSQDNILHELDDKPALDLYKKYLGEKAKELPQSALLFPLSVRHPNEEVAIVRTILNIDEESNTMIIAGDIPEGSKVQLMMSTVDDIANGARTAAKYAMNKRSAAPELALLISCVGRKLVMGQRTEEEVDEVLSVIGENTVVTGFYSYGEMAPFADQDACKLHNQTMTLTLLSE
ncbi:FIST N-terminal domain-containing protein [uncultured Kriegella sp.]|uniref:FIST signal transduction protein n=1 Tax=uncultured Kriegella sp. TaxID=1798910 RepID=UPI0030DB95ED|tara:strand:+ start:86849 stop:87985 length:1137 start_codon:yes stop_codon:yes gene_type:complete